jgi:hypothetical protein
MWLAANKQGKWATRASDPIKAEDFRDAVLEHASDRPQRRPTFKNS